MTIIKGTPEEIRKQVDELLLKAYPEEELLCEIYSRSKIWEKKYKGAL